MVECDSESGPFDFEFGGGFAVVEAERELPRLELGAVGEVMDA